MLIRIVCLQLVFDITSFLFDVTIELRKAVCVVRFILGGLILDISIACNANVQRT